MFENESCSDTFFLEKLGSYIGIHTYEETMLQFACVNQPSYKLFIEIIRFNESTFLLLGMLSNTFWASENFPQPQ